MSARKKHGEAALAPRLERGEEGVVRALQVVEHLPALLLLELVVGGALVQARVPVLQGWVIIRWWAGECVDCGHEAPLGWCVWPVERAWGGGCSTTCCRAKGEHAETGRRAQLVVVQLRHTCAPIIEWKHTTAAHGKGRERKPCAGGGRVQVAASASGTAVGGGGEERAPRTLIFSRGA